MTITDKLRNTEDKIVWSKMDQEIIEEIVEFLTGNKYLVLPNYNEMFFLQTDASQEGLGGVLYQNHGVITYISKKFNSTESNYSIVEKEMFAIVYCLEKCRNIVLGNYIEIFTDNRNCLFSPKVSSRMKRWRLLLNEYDYQLSKIEGTQNIISDYLSRCNVIRIKEDDERQKFIMQVHNFIRKKNSKVTDNVKEGWEYDKKGRAIISDEKVIDFVKYIHEYAGHPGSTVTYYYNIKDYFTGLKLKKTIKNVISNCNDCIINKKQTKKVKVVNIEAKYPFDKISMDIFGPFRLDDIKHDTNKEKGYFMTVTDIATRLTEVYFITDIKEETIIKCVKSWNEKYKISRRILTDSGVQFVSFKFEEFCLKEGG